MESYTEDGVTVQSNEASQDELQAAFDDATPETPAAETPDQPAAPEQGAKPVADSKVDKRTREGRKGSIQSEIDTLTAEKGRVTGETTAAKAERDRIAAEVADLRAQKAALATKPAAEPPAKPKTAASLPDDNPDDPKPQEADFESYADFVESRAAWAARRTYAQQDQARAEREQKGRTERFREMRTQRFVERRDAGKAEFADYDAVINEAHLPLSQPMIDVITDSEITAKLQYHLATHPEEAQRIFSLGVTGHDGRWYPNEIQQFGEMKVLEGRLSAAVSGPAQRMPVSSQAPAPVKPLRGTPTAADADSPPGDDASYEDHEKYWNNPKRLSR